MAMKMLKVLVSKLGRHVTDSALTECVREAENAAATLTRLEISDKLPQALIGGLNHVEASLTKLTPDKNGDVKVEVPQASVDAWRIALGTWMRVQSKRDKGVTAKGMTTDFPKQRKAAQELLDQLHEQLQLEPVDLDTFVKKEEPDADEEGDGGDKGLGLGSETPADPRSRRGPRLHA